MFTFILGREYKLSIAEILAVFSSGKVTFWDKEFLILEGISKPEILEKADTLGGTIKIIEMGEDTLIEDAKSHEGKFKYGISIFGEKKNLKEILMGTKKELKKASVSSRFINKDFKNLSSAQIIGEKLIKSESDYNYIKTSPLTPLQFGEGKASRCEQGGGLFGKTIWIQDIKAYSERDFSKDRDMQTGMLPPKLAQMMINIASSNLEIPSPLGRGLGRGIFDPFVGLGTILIEAFLMGFKELYGSDLNEKMVEYSKKNLKGKGEFEKLNAKFINESKFLDKADLIVTEGYLGEIMTKKNISLDRIQKQRESLKSLYEAFFANLQKAKFSGNIVISFPFWEVNGRYVYLIEIYDILSKHCEVQNLFPNDFESLATKAGSLLYKRDNQLVGREIFKLRVKK